ncbi:MAG: hypothetical protein V4489_07440 [Chlamydiota bacterium]
MKILYSLTILFPLIVFGAAEEPAMVSLEETRPLLVENEVKSLEKLIEVNECRLLVQKDLKDKMVFFQKQKDEFILGNESQKHAFSMVSNARDILGEIKKENLAYLFSSEYLEELVFFSSIAGKSSPVRP